MNELYAYVAGLVDGEGDINIQFMRDHEYGYLTVRPLLRMTLTLGADNFHAFKEKFGGRVNFHRSRKKNWSDSYTWTVDRPHELIELLKNIIPFLRIKRTNAQIVLNVLKKMVNEKIHYTKEGIMWIAEQRDNLIIGHRNLKIYTTHYIKQALEQGKLGPRKWFWTPDEIELLRRNAGTISALELVGLLPRHSRSSIRKKLFELGLVGRTICRICERKFDSPIALGQHMRYHREKGETNAVSLLRLRD